VGTLFSKLEKKSLNFESPNKTEHLMHIIDWDEPGRSHWSDWSGFNLTTS